MKLTAESSAYLKGKVFDENRQEMRRHFSGQLRGWRFDEFRTRRDELLLAHGQALLGLGAAKVMHLLPASIMTK